VEITGPGVRGGYYATRSRVIYSEELQFFKELAPGYIGRRAIILRALKQQRARLTSCFDGCASRAA